MRFPRRRFLQLAAGAAILPAAPCLALSQSYPTRPVRIIGGFPAGGTVDIIARHANRFALKKLPIELPIQSFAVAIVMLKNRTISPVAQVFIDCAREVVRPLAKRQSPPTES
jgi:hypothetical protein